MIRRSARLRTCRRRQLSQIRHRRQRQRHRRNRPSSRRRRRNRPRSRRQRRRRPRSRRRRRNRPRSQRQRRRQRRRPHLLKQRSRKRKLCRRLRKAEEIPEKNLRKVTVQPAERQQKIHCRILPAETHLPVDARHIAFGKAYLVREGRKVAVTAFALAKGYVNVYSCQLLTPALYGVGRRRHIPAIRCHIHAEVIRNLHALSP